MSVLVLFVGTLFVGIWLNMHYELPKRNDPAVVKETARAVTAVERYVAAANGARSARCSARLLKSDGGVAMVHAACALVPGPSALAGPFRVAPDGSVKTARDGSAFQNDVKSMFGDRLGDWYLNHANSFSYVIPPAAPDSGAKGPLTTN